MLAFSACKDDAKETALNADKVEKKAPKPVTKEFGFILDDYKVVNGVIESGDSFGYLLDQHGVDRGKIYQISEKVKDTFNPARITAGRKYMILKAKDSANTPQYFIYQNDRINYTVVGIGDSISASRKKKPVIIKKREVSGVVSSSLSEAVAEQGLSNLLVYELSDIYQWSIDFFKLQKGDQFKMIYSEKYIDDTIFAGIENVEAAVFKHEDRPFYAFQYETDSVTGQPSFYDEEAKALQSFFLKAPLNYSRISSRYTKRRFHPVQKRWKAHLGTDYAASRGTPIVSTADGTVIAASYTSGNGNYVKVRHNDKYTTQYLHMSKRNVRNGQRVKQGDVIGFVGSTGLATGPHVCYRFWVHGKQVDPYRQNLPTAKHIEPAHKEEYFAAIEDLRTALDEISYKEI
ncbi:Murein DD-endopeptidase MepM and murein hydrolase activator NlpD, contain LysM domain [Salegentibacter holothuriorum]|uniref:Murein DD-endopeptidase MepM and murein hydrolase activator NlpD, contain LysM domain n=2 Tax=Salegentibacter holothuriorum TaxID=241145 RepID=A0A1T5C1D3_9FLAO|nr:Murein DD-endopeptidase MepM and murein hydrolase activator NlpD, contain LysM domain [Salegentibacter holothuriorum]